MEKAGTASSVLNKDKEERLHPHDRPVAFHPHIGLTSLQATIADEPLLKELATYPGVTMVCEAPTGSSNLHTGDRYPSETETGRFALTQDPTFMYDCKND